MQSNPFVELADQLGATWTWILFGLLVTNALPILVVLLAGPRSWARALALVTLQTNLYLVWIALGVGSAGLLTNARLLPCLIPFLLLLAQLVVLLVVCRWRLHMESFDVKLRP